MNYELRISNQLLDLPQDMQLSLQRESPFFSKEGSFALPLTLPDTDHNRQQLGFINRLDMQMTSSSTNQFSAILTIGAMQQQVTLTVLSYAPGEGFEVSLLLAESCIWNRLQGVSLKQVLQTRFYDPPVRTALHSSGQGSVGTTTPDDTIEALDERARRQDSGNTATLTNDIRTRLFTDFLDSLNPEFEVATVITPNGVINEPVPPADPDMSAEPYHLMLIDGEKVLGPEGIGHSVFLHLDYVIYQIFDYIGRTLDMEEVRNRKFVQPEGSSNITFGMMLRRILILNQTIDALVPGRIYYDTLVPDVQCLDLLQALFALFGVGFIEQTDGTVRMRLLEDVLTQTPEKLNLSRMQDLQYKSPAALEIQPGHIRQEDDAELETPEQLSKYGNISADGIKQFDIFGSDEYGFIMNDTEVSIGDLGVNAETDNLCVACKDSGDMYSRLVGPNQTGFLHPVKGTTEVEYEAEQVEAPFSDTHPADTYRLLPTAQRYPELLRCMTALMPGLRNETCTVEQTVTKENKDGTTTTEKRGITRTDDCPLCFAYYTGRLFYTGSDDPAVVLPQYWYQQEDPDQPGTYIKLVAPHLALHMTGIAQTLHRSYNAAMMAGAHRVTLKAMMNMLQIRQFRFDCTYIIDGVRYLPLQMQTQTGDRDLQEVTITMMKV